MIKKIFFFALAVISLTACDDNESQPHIDSVWVNVSSEPVREVSYAYPGQLLCLHGSGFDGLQKIEVNGYDISITGSLIYDNDRYVTFTCPSDIYISEDYKRCDIKVTTAGGECIYTPFIIKPTSEKPAISRFSTTALLAGTNLTITGRHFGTVKKVLLPGTFDTMIECELADGIEPTETSVTVVVPEDVKFATGRACILMEMVEYISDPDGRKYEECVYSSETSFTN